MSLGVTSSICCLILCKYQINRLFNFHSKIERGLILVSADLLEKLSDNFEITAAHLFCKPDEKIYNDDMIKKSDRITEKHLIGASA